MIDFKASQTINLSAVLSSSLFSIVKRGKNLRNYCNAWLLGLIDAISIKFIFTSASQQQQSNRNFFPPFPEKPFHFRFYQPFRVAFEIKFDANLCYDNCLRANEIPYHRSKGFNGKILNNCCSEIFCVFRHLEGRSRLEIGFVCKERALLSLCHLTKWWKESRGDFVQC
jgi:hypothetical protein